MALTQQHVYHFGSYGMLTKHSVLVMYWIVTRYPQQYLPGLLLLQQTALAKCIPRPWL